jgi:hypothetical protein
MSTCTKQQLEKNNHEGSLQHLPIMYRVHLLQKGGNFALGAVHDNLIEYTHQGQQIKKRNA